MLERFERF